MTRSGAFGIRATAISIMLLVMFPVSASAQWTGGGTATVNAFSCGQGRWEDGVYHQDFHLQTTYAPTGQEPQYFASFSPVQINTGFYFTTTTPYVQSSYNGTVTLSYTAGTGFGYGNPPVGSTVHYFIVGAVMDTTSGGAVSGVSYRDAYCVVPAMPQPTPTPAPTNTPVPTPTNTPVPTPTNTPVPTPTNTPVPTPTNTPVPTATSTPEPTATNTPEPTATTAPSPTATTEPGITPTATTGETPTVTPGNPTVTVRVVMPNGQNIAGMPWDLYQPSTWETQPYRSGTVGTNNTFELADLPPGTYRLVVRPEGMNPVEATLEITGESRELVVQASGSPTATATATVAQGTQPPGATSTAVAMPTVAALPNTGAGGASMMPMMVLISAGCIVTIMMSAFVLRRSGD